MRPCVVGIDASRNRSGGAKHHLIGVLGAGDPPAYGITAVHVWSYRGLLDALPQAPWLIKHNPAQLERSLLEQAVWQRLELPKEMGRHGCNLLLSTDAGTLGTYEPSVVMSRDMLSYEPGEMNRYGFCKARLRLVLLRHIQARSLKRARAAIFLTNYAAEAIQRFTGKLSSIAVIPHGVGESFRGVAQRSAWTDQSREIRCVYVSNAELYKHQWHVVSALAQLRNRGLDISLTLAGGASGRAAVLLERELARSDPRREFVRAIGVVRYEALPRLLAESDLFIFASSCENMPNTLIEGMASGLPIACSDRGPMPEVLRDGGVYFDPEQVESIAHAVENLIRDAELRSATVCRAQQLAAEYSWARCARETWGFLSKVAADAACTRCGGSIDSG